MRVTQFPAIAASLIGLFFSANSWAQTNLSEALRDPIVQEFVGAAGLGALHANAPQETLEFGQLVGIWRAEQQLLIQDKGWVQQPEAIWAWKYILGGYATQDLWYQSEDRLPEYLGISGRPYLLTGIRVFDAGGKKWKVAWASNSGGETPGDTAGSFEAMMKDGDIVMLGSPIEGPQGRALQRVVFHDIKPDRFKWRSDFSPDDGANWMTVMKVEAIRLK